MICLHSLSSRLFGILIPRHLIAGRLAGGENPLEIAEITSIALKGLHFRHWLGTQ